MLLQINDLTTSYFKEGSELKALDSVRLKIPESSIFALIGESGCGKTTLGLSITDLIDPRDGRIVSGSVIFYDEYGSTSGIEGRNILRLPADELRDLRGRRIAYIFQEPASSLNPVFTIGQQISESLLMHKIADKKNVKEKALTALGQAQLADPERIFDSYPHQLSGGMKQRAMIAMAISAGPKLLIADEPTTALDVDTESEILELLILLRKELSLSVLLITHDIRLVERRADYIAVMYQGKIVEVGEARRILTGPKHDYTKLLLDSMPERLRL